MPLGLCRSLSGSLVSKSENQLARIDRLSAVQRQARIKFLGGQRGLVQAVPWVLNQTAIFIQALT